jgi:hypothetical protein
VWIRQFLEKKERSEKSNIFVYSIIGHEVSFTFGSFSSLCLFKMVNDARLIEMGAIDFHEKRNSFEKYIIFWSNRYNCWGASFDLPLIMCTDGFLPRDGYQHEGHCIRVVFYFDMPIYGGCNWENEWKVKAVADEIRLAKEKNSEINIQKLNHRLETSESNKRTNLSYYCTFVVSIFSSSKLFPLETSWSDLIRPFIGSSNKVVGFFQDFSKPIQLNIEYKLSVPFLTHGFLHVIDNWKSDLIANLRRDILNFNGSWKLSYYDLFVPKNAMDDEEYSRYLPKPRKLSLQFHCDNGPTRYFPRPSSDFCFEGIDESSLPSLRAVRENLQREFNCTLNWSSCQIYFDETSRILYHSDASQNCGKADNKEIIITLCVLGNKMMVFRSDATQEKLFILHSENQIYVMDGIQNGSQHAKPPTSLKNPTIQKLFPQLRHCKQHFHVSFVFRNIENWDNKMFRKELFTSLKVDWTNLQQLQLHWNKSETYVGLRPEEPVGFVWKSRYHMNHFGAFSQLICGMNCKDGIIAAVIDNVYDNAFKTTTAHYKGHTSVSSILHSYNRMMVQTASKLQPIRYYLGYKSKNAMAPSNGYKLMGLYYVFQIKLEKYDGFDVASKYGKGFKRNKSVETSQNKKFQWTFELMNEFFFKQLFASVHEQICQTANFLLQCSSEKDMLENIWL